MTSIFYVPTYITNKYIYNVYSSDQILNFGSQIGSPVEFIFDSKYINKKIKCIYFNSNITFYELDIVDILPDYLEVLVFDEKCNQYLQKLPKSLKILILGTNYEQVLPELPESLQVLIITSIYNHQLPNIPKNLKVLHFTYGYKYKLDLPQSLKDFKLGMHCQFGHIYYLFRQLGLYEYQHQLKLPKSLKRFEFGQYYRSSLKLPGSLKVIRIPNHYERALELGESIRTITIGNKCNIVKIPAKIKTIEMELELFVKLYEIVLNKYNLQQLKFDIGIIRNRPQIEKQYGSGQNHIIKNNFNKKLKKSKIIDFISDGNGQRNLVEDVKKKIDAENRICLLM